MIKDIGIYLISAIIFCFMFLLFGQVQEAKIIENDCLDEITKQKKELKKKIKEKQEKAQDDKKDLDKLKDQDQDQDEIK